MCDRPALPSPYPTTRRCDQVDDYHGTIVADPYRWLEAGADEPEVRAWIGAQNALTFDYLERLPGRGAIAARLAQLWDYEKFGVPFKRGDRYFYFKNDGLQNQSVLYVQESLTGPARVLLDPNALSEDGTVALGPYAVSHDARYLAYSLSRSGSDWQEWRVRDVMTGEDLPDLVQWSKFSGASWTHDGAGFFYSRYDEPIADRQFEDANFYQKLYYHRLGTAQAEDELIFHCPDQKEWSASGEVTEDGRFLCVSIWRDTTHRCRFLYRDLQDPSADFVELIDNFDAVYRLIGNDDRTFWFLTDNGASRQRVIAIDLDRPEPEHWRELIPEAAETLDQVSVLNDRFVAGYLKDARSVVRIFALTGQFEREMDLPGIGSVGGFRGDRADTETFYSFTSFTTPTTIYRYDLVTHEQTVFRAPTVAFDPQDYETRQFFYQSLDGTTVPMFISHRKGLKLDGNNPTLLYGYGGFNVSLTPTFSISNLVWMELGGVYALPNLRGGGEYGEDWHEAGTKTKKQNVFDDFIAAAQWLIDQGYTRSQNLAIYGGSNGGLLVGACMVQRPDLFAVAIPAVGVLDMLRFHQFTIGWAWCSDYGHPDNPEEFAALYGYSPLHNLKPQTAYPATMITTGDRDDRVVPAHSFKFAAALQAAQGGDAPTLIRIDTKAGHGAGKPTAKLIEEAGDRLTFSLAHMEAGTAILEALETDQDSSNS
ncbi:MAG: prolyl oligopeptidase family serine peptidase [Cyanobacteria bacterium]|nr:prolyl oligopeptidase family serine peptidase [Cyanobacteriota bacterium]